MNLIVSFVGLGEKLGVLNSGRPYPLQRLAGSTILGHVLSLLADVLEKKVVLIVEGDVDEFLPWLQEMLPTVEFEFVVTGEGVGPLKAVYACIDKFDPVSTLLVFGQNLVDADYRALISSPADVAAIENPGTGEWAGILWVRRVQDLRAALETAVLKASGNISDLLPNLSDQGLEITIQEAYFCLDTRSPDGLLHANARLLGLGYGSEDAIERSYAEDFTALPPVFVHESATIQNSVIGPFVNVEAESVVRNSIVRNSLVGVETEIENANLDGSLIGDHVRIIGTQHSIIAGDGSQIEFD